MAPLTFKAFDHNYDIMDLLLVIAIVCQYSSELRILPFTINTTALLLMGLIQFIRIIRKKQFPKESLKLILILAYIALITFTHYHEPAALKDLALFSFFSLTLALYSYSEQDKTKLISLLYFSASILAIYGVIQEITYLIGIPAIYDPTNWGFRRFYATKIGGGLISIYSLYDEPSHLAGIFCAGILIGTHKDKSTNKTFAFTNPIITVIILIMSMLTASATVYLGLIISMILIVADLDVSKRKKGIIAGISAMSLVIFFILFPSIFNLVVKMKLLGLYREFFTIGNMTTFAIASNIRVAFAKMMDGHIFGTGFDSNRYYYYDYVDKIYGVTGTYMNPGDAASMFTRIFSEFGIVGLLLTLAFLGKRTVQGIRQKNWPLLLMIVLFVIQGSRNGNYLNTLLIFSFVSVLYPFEKEQQSLQ